MPAPPGSSVPPRRALRDAAAAAALAGLVFLLYGRAIGWGGPGFWWSDDDFFNLRFLSTFGPAEIALDPAVWRQLPFRMLTPLLFLSLQLDAALWGLDPAAFYLHQLSSLALAVAALHLVLRLWLPLPWAAAGAALFLLGPPAASLVPLLAVRHYVEALLLGLLAAGAFALAVRRRSPVWRLTWSLASAALGFLAMAAKEIAVPLPALLLLLPDGTVRERLRAALPHAAGLALYVVYRVRMLDTLAGGYGFAAPPGGWPELALALPGKIARQVAGGEAAGPAGWLLLALTAAAAAAFLLGRAGRRAAALTAAALLLALLPVLPVSVETPPRYALPAWLALAVAAGAAGARFAGPHAGPHTGWLRRALVLGLTAGALGSAVAAHRAAWAGEVARAERKAAENRFAFRMTAGDLLRHPLDRPAALRELGWLRGRQLGLSPAGGWFYDDLYLSRPEAAGRRVWGYAPAAGRMVDLTARVPHLRARHRAATRPEAPLSAVFRSTGAAVHWELGPDPAADYALVFGDGLEVDEVPRRAGFQRRVERTALRVRSTAPDGRVTYSPELVLDFTAASEIRWSRPARLTAPPPPAPATRPAPR